MLSTGVEIVVVNKAKTSPEHMKTFSRSAARINEIIRDEIAVVAALRNSIKNRFLLVL